MGLTQKQREHIDRAIRNAHSVGPCFIGYAQKAAGTHRIHVKQYQPKKKDQA